MLLLQISVGTREVNVVRAILLLTIVITSGSLLAELVTSGGSGSSDTGAVVQHQSGVVDNVTVITTTNFSRKYFTEDGEIFAIDGDGDIIYRNTTYGVYDDVDPSPRGQMTVQYVAAEALNESECPNDGPCTRNVIERVNLTTDETTVLYSRITPKIGATRWHDADRLNEHEFVLADIDKDRISIVNTTRNDSTVVWRATSDYDLPDDAESPPRDWSHLNDVEVVADNRYMVSLRNFDEVVFVNEDGELLENLTIGEDNDYSILNRQHNPDYIPSKRGGVSVVIADSQNNRIIEYQRIDGSWVETWTWSDREMAWPRDADRLPNGHTLITDTNSGRVLQVNESGDIVWSVRADEPYEAERLGTGDESAGGRSARSLGLESRVENASRTKPVDRIEALFPTRLLNGIRYVLPSEITFSVLLQLMVLGVSGFGLIVYERSRLKQWLSSRLQRRDQD